MREKADNYLVFAFTMILVVTVGQQLLGAGAKKMGWTGVASFFKRG